MTGLQPLAESAIRVLVVEDEALIAEEIRDRLSRMHYEVVGVEDTGPRAVEAAGRMRPDLVLMDIRLKGPMDGIEAAARIQAQQEVPIVYLTAHSDASTLDRAKSTAPLGYILKPFQERDLFVNIEMALHRHTLERQLRESELRYSATLSSIGDGVIATDPHGQVSFINPVAEELTGWGATDARGTPVERVLRLLDESTHHPLEHPVARTLHQRSVSRLDRPALLSRRDGSVLPVDDSIAPIVDPRGQLLGAVVAFSDISARRAAERALQQAEVQLRHSQKMEAIGRLAAGIAHDFNNLLTVINGCSELLLVHSVPGSPAHHLLEQVKRAGAKSAQLTRQLLAFSRKQMLAPQVVDLNDLVRDVIGMLPWLVGEKVEIIHHAGPTATVRIDPGQIEQVIINLATNARDAMPDGGVLTVAIDTTPTAPHEVVLRISDSGSGIDESVRERLFEPFVTTKHDGSGTGLGLATAYGIVKQSGGTITVASTSGLGTTFEVRLPFVDAEPRPEPEPLVRSRSLRGHETILLVEDRDEVREVLAGSLERWGYEVLRATGADDALRICAQHVRPIDLVLTDIAMPGLSGLELARRILRMRSGVKLIYMSGRIDEDLLRLDLLEGTAEFLQKPFTLEVLAGTVRKLLDRQVDEGS